MVGQWGEGEGNSLDHDNSEIWWSSSALPNLGHGFINVPKDLIRVSFQTIKLSFLLELNRTS